MTERKRGVATFLAKTEIQANDESFKLAKSPKGVCWNSHGIEECANFLKLSIEEIGE